MSWWLPTQASTFAPQIDGIEYNISQPAVYKWSLDVEQQVAPDTTLRATVKI